MLLYNIVYSRVQRARARARDQVRKGVDQQVLCPQYFDGIFLPVEIDAEKCERQPLVLAYHNSHFQPLVHEDEQQGACIGAIASSGARTPIVYRSKGGAAGRTLPVRFLCDTDDEESLCVARYLDTSDEILAVGMSCRTASGPAAPDPAQASTAQSDVLAKVEAAAVAAAAAAVAEAAAVDEGALEGDLAAQAEEGWVCWCTWQNPADHLICSGCESERKGGGGG